MINRHSLSQKYAKGLGIDIGAYHNPFPFDAAKVTMKYLDKWPYEKLLQMRDQDSSLTPFMHIAKPDYIVPNDETLSIIPSNQFDFLVSSHQIEHTHSPLTSIEHHLRIVKPNGYLIYAVPDKRFTFDRDRPITQLSHVISDASDYNPTSNAQPGVLEHYLEYLLNVDKIESLEKRREIADQRIANNEDVHFHCWDANACIELFTAQSARAAIQIPFTLELFYQCGHENFVVLKKGEFSGN